MKRTVPLIMLISTAGLLVPILVACGESPGRPDGKAQWASGCSGKPSAAVVSCSPHSCCAKAVSKSDQVINELTAILNETKSAETFLITTMVLGRMGPGAKQAIPVIIRNAERLELLEDVHSPRSLDDNRNLATQKVIAALEMILPCPSPYAPSACTSSGCTAPVANWNAPAGTPVPATPMPVPVTPPLPVKPTSEVVPTNSVPGTVVN